MVYFLLAFLLRHMVGLTPLMPAKRFAVSFFFHIPSYKFLLDFNVSLVFLITVSDTDVTPGIERGGEGHCKHNFSVLVVNYFNCDL